jgi:putative ABC transport system substrate-binding protein
MRGAIGSILFATGCAGARPTFEPRWEEAGRDPGAPEIVVLVGSDNPLYDRPVAAFRAQATSRVAAFSVPDDPERMMRSVRARRPALIVAIGPYAALTARRHAPEVPLLFTMVVNHGQYAELAGPGIMGVSLEPPPAQEFVQFKLLLPGLRRVLTFYTPRESDGFIERATAELAALGIELIAVPARSPADIEDTLSVASADAVWMWSDPVMANDAAFEVIRARSMVRSLPLVTSLSDDYARAGALVSVGVDFRSVGSQAAAIANLFLEGGRSPSEIGVQAPAGTILSLNRATADQLGITVPDEAIQFIDRFFPDSSSAMNELRAPVLAEHVPPPLFDLIVEVSAKRAQPVAEAASVVSVFTARQMRELGFRTLGELLDHVTAIQRVALPNAETLLVVRGLGTENGVAILVDGVPVLDPVTGQFAHYDLPLVGLDRVEIQRGPGSALYGGNAQAAVINLVTSDRRDAAGGLGGRLLTGGHGWWATDRGPYGSLFVAAAAHRFVSPDQRFESDGTRTRGDLLGGAPQSLVDPARADRIDGRSEPVSSGMGRVRYVSPWGLIANGIVAIEDVSPLVNPGPGGTRGRTAVTREGDFRKRSTLGLFDLRYQTSLGPTVDVFASGTYVLNHRRQGGSLTGPLALAQDRDQSGGFDEWPDGMIERFTYAAHTGALEVRGDVELPFHNVLTFGVAGSYAALSDLRYESNFQNASSGPSIGLAPTAGAEVVDRTGEVFILPASSRLSLGVFLQDAFDPTPWLSILGGVRADLVLDRGILSDGDLRRDQACAADRFGLCEPRYADVARGKRTLALSPRAAAVVRLPYTLRLKLLWGAAFTPPPLGALTNQTFSENLGARAGDPLLSSLTSQTLELVLRSTGDRRFTGEVAGFWIRTQDEVVFDPTTSTFQNNAHRNVLGLEASITGELPLGGSAHALLYAGGLSFHRTLAEERPLIGLGADVYSTFLLKARLGIRLFEWLTISAVVLRTSMGRREPLDDRPRIPSYVLVDLRLAAADPDGGLTFGFFAKNLFDVRYADPTIDAAGLESDFPRGGRTLEAVIEYDF